MELTLASIKKNSLPILRRHGVKKAAIFGSYARDQQHQTSDVDILVELDNNKSLFDLVGLRQDLQDRLGKRIDVNTYRALNRHVKTRVLREQKRIL